MQIKRQPFLALNETFCKEHPASLAAFIRARNVSGTLPRHRQRFDVKSTQPPSAAKATL